MNFEVLWLFVKALSAKFGYMAYFGGTNKQSTSIFLQKLFPPIHKSFLL